MRGRIFRGRTQGQREALIESRLLEIERGNWEQKVADYKAGRTPLPPIGGASPVKARWASSAGLQGFASAWDIPDLVEYDYAYLNLAGAITYLGCILGITPGTNAALIGSPDALGASLTAASGNRVIGSGSAPYATVLSAWIFSRALGGTVYTAAAGTTLQVQVISCGGATQAATNLTAATNVNALTSFWTQMPITAPTERQVVYAGTPNATISSIYYGDMLLGALVTTGALNIQSNQLSVVLELA